MPLPACQHNTSLLQVDTEDIRAIGTADFDRSIKNIRPSVSRELMATMERWNAHFGSTA